MLPKLNGQKGPHYHLFSLIKLIAKCQRS